VKTAGERISVADAIGQIPEILDSYSWPYKGVPGQLPCPIHRRDGEMERRYSAKIYEDNYIYCYTCGRQYGPVDILVSLARTTREKAAEEILRRWPPTQEQITAALVDYTTPKHREVPVEAMQSARAALLNYRHRVPLPIYREWALRLEKLKVAITKATEPEQLKITAVFKRQLKDSLSNTIKELENGRE